MRDPVDLSRVYIQFRSVFWIVIALGCAASECAAPSGRVQEEPAAESAHTEFVGLGGNVYSGILPCASCAGIDTRIRLRDDHTFWRARTYLGDAEEARNPVYDIGSWAQTVGGRVVLTSNEGSVTRFTGEGGDELILLDLAGRTIDSLSNHALQRVDGDFGDMGPFRLRGMYIYFADAAILLPCNTGTRLPVAMVERHVDLEQNYLKHRAGPAAPLFVEIEAEIRQMPAMEGDGKEEAIVVKTFVRSDTLESCRRPSDLDDPAGWELTELDGVVVGEQDGRSTPELTFASGQVTGSTGCNRLMGPITVADDSLTFGPLAVTRRACIGSVENEFLAALEATDRFAISNRRLNLLKGDRSVAAFSLREGQ